MLGLRSLRQLSRQLDRAESLQVWRAHALRQLNCNPWLAVRDSPVKRCLETLIGLLHSHFLSQLLPHLLHNVVSEAACLTPVEHHCIVTAVIRRSPASGSLFLELALRG